MYTSSVRALRADLATAVRRAGAGEYTVVTVHGRPVATLGPVDSPRAGEMLSADQLVASGAVLPARRRTAWRPGEPIEIWTGTRIDQALREIRG